MAEMGRITRTGLWIPKTHAMTGETVEIEIPKSSHFWADCRKPIRISPVAYLRSVWSLFVACFFNPLKATVEIDLTTGRIVGTR